jgi:hypothetical protein
MLNMCVQGVGEVVDDVSRCGHVGYKWSPSALDVDRMKEHELYHSAPFRH